MVGSGVAVAIRSENVHLHYGAKHVLKGVDFAAHENRVTALIGPSGCGKTSFLRCLNRMNDRIPTARFSGSVTVNGFDPYSAKVDLMKLRRTVGMVFQKPNPFPMSIYDNVAMAPKLHFGVRGKALDEVVETALHKAALWDEVKDEYKKGSGLALSGGQQQRLCIARALATNPRVILMDEPCSALDPISTAKIEDLIVELAKSHTVLVVTHNLQQAARISHSTAFFMLGEIVELGDTRQMFEAPKTRMAEEYIGGRFG
jgi:phosphate transport system ATP-binding protein